MIRIKYVVFGVFVKVINLRIKLDKFYHPEFNYIWLCCFWQPFAYAFKPWCSRRLADLRSTARLKALMDQCRTATKGQARAVHTTRQEYLQLSTNSLMHQACIIHDS